MNRKQRRGAQAQNKRDITIKYAGKSYPIAKAVELATAEYKHGNFQAATDIYDRILAIFPDYVEAHNSRGETLHNLKRYDEALASYDRAIAFNPAHTKAHNNRGIALHELKRYDEALASYDQAIALNPTYAEVHSNRGLVLQELKRYDEAQESYRRAIALKPDWAGVYNNLGMMLAYKGDLQKAEAMYMKAIELQPSANPLYNLVHIRKYRDADHTDVRIINQLLANPSMSPGDREQLYFALGKIYDDCSRYEEAFECFRRANEIRGNYSKYNPEIAQNFTRDTKNVFTRDFLDQSPAWASYSSTPIFVVGMPRSGTTLMASLVSNHPDVDMAGELPDIIRFANAANVWTEAGTPFPHAVRHLTPAVAARFTDSYEKRLRRDAHENTKFIIDKHPLNFRYLGFIAMLFPRARIIHCMRDPLDTCLSNYFQRFGLGYDYSFNLESIGHFYGEYMKVMAHWREVLPAKMIEVRYEDMVTDTPRVAREVLDGLGLAWDDRCAATHTNRSVVDTASLWQVRQPVYKDSLERWRNYEKQLAPLKDIISTI